MQTTIVPNAPEIAVDHMGKGPLVVFLHGVGGNKRNWHPNLPAFAANFHAAAWDARGYEQSADVEGPRALTDFRDDLARVLDHFGAEAAHIVGLSLGGRIAGLFHASNPGRVASLTLCDTHLGFQHFTEAQAQSFVALRRDPLRKGQTPADIAPKIARTLIGDPADAHVFAALVDSLSRLRPDSYIKTLEASVRLDRAPLFDHVTVPTLVVAGALDRLTPPKLAQAIAARVPGARLAIIEGAGNLPNIERPDAFNRTVLAFLKDAESGRHAADASAPNR